MKYLVNIEETLTRNVTVEADSEEQAEIKVKQLYYNGEIVLDYSDYIGEPTIKCKHSCNEIVKSTDLD